MVRVYDLAPEAVIFTRGYWQEALKLYGGLEFDGDNTAEKLFEATPFLVVVSIIFRTFFFEVVLHILFILYFPPVLKHPFL